jgi:CMP-N-acetylneuraminic acid synthetase
MCGNIYGHILSKQESIDIDDIFDFKFAEYLYTNKINLDEEE